MAGHLHEHVTHAVQHYGPLLVGLITLGEAMGVPLPAETALLSAAVYAGTTHHLSIYAVVGAAIAGAIIGDNIGYAIGHYAGAPLLRRWGRYIGLNEDRQRVGRYLFRHHGALVVFFGRFVSLLRTLASLLAGAMHMRWWPTFFFANAAGGILWASLYGFGAYALGTKVHTVGRPVEFALGGVALVAVIAGVVFVRRNEARLVERAKRENV